MTRGHLVSLGAAIALGAFGCGDNNTKSCDPGTTMDVDGVCTGTGGAGSCSDGTILVDDHCEIDPNACQDGTVLVGSECKDPGAVTADIEEAAEPNGLGLFGEVSTDPAGTIALKPEGEHFVIHGKIIPFQDADGDGQQDGDIDSYLIDVTAPVTLSVSADGLHGLAGGFVSVAAVNSDSPLASWARFGVNPAGDTSARKLYLPAAGTYLISIADTRSLFLTGAAPGATEGNPDLEYYVTIDLVATPAATPLTATDGVATSAGTMDPGDLKLFTVAIEEGITSAELAVTIEQAQESVLVANTHSGATTFKAVGDGDPGDAATAFASMLGSRTGDEATVVVDSVFDYANAPYDYDLTVTLATAGALSTTGGDVAQPSGAELSTFFYDVAAGQELIGMDIAFDREVTGVVVDEDFFIYSLFTYDPDFGFAIQDTFQSYKGLLNHQLPGRYYFLVFDPDGGAADIVATSTYGAVTPVAVTKGTSVQDQATNAFDSTPFTYDAGTATDPWQQFKVGGTGTGAITGTFFDAATAYGRLDELVNTCGIYCDDRPVPVFEQSYAQSGTTRGRILLDDGTSSYFVTMHTATTTGSPTLDLTFSPRPFTDLGMLADGAMASETDQVLDNVTPVQRYLVRTMEDYELTVVTSPHALTLNTRIKQDDVDESGLQTADTGGGGADDTMTVTQGANGWTAIEVTGFGTGLLTGSFDVTVSATAP